MKIFHFVIRDMVIDLNVGIYEKEKAAPQRVLVNIEGEFDYGGTADDITATFDYDRVYKEVKRLAATRHFELQEFFCSQLVDVIAGMDRILSVSVATQKMDIYADCAGIGVRASWRRERVSEKEG